MDGGIIGMVVFFGFLAAIILVPVWLKERTKQSAHHLISQALERGQPLDPGLVRQLTEGMNKQAPKERGRGTLASGIVLACLSGAFVASAFIIGGMTGDGIVMGMLIPAVILGALAAAFILLALIDFASNKKDQ